MGLPSHQHQNPNTIPSHQHRIQLPSHPISTRLPLPSHPIYTRRRLPSHPINAFLRVSHPIPSHQCIFSCFPSHRITIIKESDSHPSFVMVKLKKIPACGGLSDGIPSHVVPSAPRIALILISNKRTYGTIMFVDATRFFGCMVASRGGYRMARGGHYAKLSLSNAPRLSFSGLCILLFLFLSLCRFFCVFLFCSHWSLVDVPLIFFCPADHVPDWQPRVVVVFFTLTDRASTIPIYG